jgi:hypothetical protein
MHVAELDPGLAARIVSRRSLYYREGKSAALDRPEHVRAASGAAWLGDRLALIQDDAQFIALVEVKSGVTESVPLPAGSSGQRLFDDTRGTKHLKLDLEACWAVPGAETTELFALGSGSKPVRERIVVLRYDHGTRKVTSERVVDASSLYASLHAAVPFSGSELNIEGAVLRETTLLLFQRGNGAPRDGRRPVNAVASLSWPSFVRYVESGGAAAVPNLLHVAVYELGTTASGVPYTFTDATLSPGGTIVFLASAEDSSSAVTDGVVHGTYLGEIEQDGTARVAPLLDEHGQPARAKAEGIAFDRDDPTLAWVVTDMDDPASASELLEVRLAFSP